MAFDPNASSDSVETSVDANSTITRSSKFYFDCVVFQVVLYSLPRSKLIETSTVFEDMFSLPQGATSGKNSEGTCDEYPIHLEHIKRKDWECLLGLLFNSNSQVLGQASIPDFTLDEWESVLNLSTKWEMAAVRECAIEKINQFDNPAKKIQLARNYRVPRFFLPCLVQLVARSDPIIPQELSELGIECALKLVSIRERIYNGNNNYATFRPEKAPLDASTPGSTVWNNTVAVLHAIFTDHDEHYK